MWRSEIIYDCHTGLNFGVTDGQISNIIKLPKRQKHYLVSSTVSQLGLVIDQPIHMANGRLFLDPFALTDIAVWLFEQHPKWSGKRHYIAIGNMFPGSIFFDDAMLAMLRIVHGREEDAQGETQYFIEEAYQRHAKEWSELRADRGLPPFRSLRV